ncbi:phosphoenolpyruvate carboxylase [Adhaeretor mobilis]|uniref:Phosphoenolpyruvate carboxylase n=1 Tax=Adhaeretor mobilis TaxID=1930276 RepID=A0A517N2G3_9BACT|nr:phosphoenolpyruvate carboxylase [Adhaeretor mobilis]QDT01324.1 Phosphoenolpyruvate carboxylase [Adhaeretor mobilis]
MPRAPELSREIDQLGRLCGDIIKQLAGGKGFELVEQVRRLARETQRAGSSPNPTGTQSPNDAATELDELLQGLDPHQIEVVTRSFTVFLELANLAEDRQRVRVLHQRQQQAHPYPSKETVRAAIADFHERGLSAKQVQAYVDQARIELVLTAHPTEAKRRAVRRLLGDMRRLLGKLDASDLLPTTRQRLHEKLAAQLSKLSQTDFLRPWRPTVMQEVERGLSIRHVLWEQVPRIASDLRSALAEFYPEVIYSHPMVEYNSWIGGDRDGNPFVTPEITAQTLREMRDMAFEKHLASCRKLSRSLSLSDRQTPPAAELTDAITAAGKQWPPLAEELEKLPPLESYRRWLHVVAWRLERTAEVDLAVDGQSANEGASAYVSPAELLADLAIMRDSLVATGNQAIYDADVQPWVDQIEAFAFHTARLDIRQDSGVYRDVLNEVWKLTGDCEAPEKLDEPARQKLLVETLGKPFTVPKEASDTTRETFELFTLLRRTARRFGLTAIGSHIVSMTRVPSDLLVVLWLWRWSEQVDGTGNNEADSSMHLPLVPLFETIDDLKQAPDTLTSLLAEPAYREYVRQQGDRQTAMVGYSDSTKDGGYFSAQVALQTGQTGLAEVAKREGVDLTFFHGRGGSLGRGGGPAAKSVLSLPTEAFNGTLRLTEQGEVLADRYDNPAIAHRHLEQLTWAVLTAVSQDPTPPPAQWQSSVEQLAESSLKAYRELVDHPTFADFYRQVTPISAIEQLPIGSRPSKRKGGNRIEDLRAIPWVYSWTQCRCLLPAWYGLGSAFEAYVGDQFSRLESLQKMHREWPFFGIAIDNSMHALAQANMSVFAKYASLATGVEEHEELTEAILKEFERSRHAVLAITGSSQLLDRIPWLQRSIKARNGYVDPLNLLQVELLRRGKQDRVKQEVETGDDDQLNQWEHLTHLTVKGVSTGMRTTG